MRCEEGLSTLFGNWMTSLYCWPSFLAANAEKGNRVVALVWVSQSVQYR